MDTENCTNLYLQVCQTFLTCKYDDPTTFDDLYKLLPWLRQSLTCCVCANLVTDPMSSTQSHCQHFVCGKCKGGKMILRPQCSWCKDAEAFEVNQHLVVLVMCFKKICQLISASPIFEHIINYDKKRKKELAASKSESPTKADTPTKRKRAQRKFARRYVTNSLLNIPVQQVLQDAMNIEQLDVSSQSTDMADHKT